MKHHYAIIVGMAIVSIGTSVFLYDYFMPAWMIIERTDYKDDPNIVGLTDDDMVRYPILQRNMPQLDEWYLEGSPTGAVEKTSKTEAIEIASLLEIHDERPVDRGNFIYDDKTYYIMINYQYDRPAYIEGVDGAGS